MKIVRIIAGAMMAGALGLGLWACQGAEAKVAEIKVNNMVCGTCAAAIEAALKKVEGVQDVKVDKDAKVATVRYEAGKVDVKGLEKAVSMAGYNANDTAADPKAHADLPDCCKI